MAPTLTDSLYGKYEAVVNGVPIKCEVVSVKFLVEGFGTYDHLISSNQIAPGRTLLAELGHGTVEVLLIDSDGTPTVETYEDLGVRKVIDEIVSHPLLTALSGTRSRRFSPPMVVNALRTGVPPSGRVSAEQWQSILTPAVDAYWERVRNFMLNTYSDDFETVTNIVLCGGGSMLLGDRIAPPLTRPKTAQTSSVEGAYHWALRNA